MYVSKILFTKRVKFGQVPAASNSPKINMNWVAIQTAAQEMFGSSSSPTPSERAPTAAVASDSSSDEDNDVQGVVMAKNKKQRATKSITATQEKILNQLLHKWRANVRCLCQNQLESPASIYISYYKHPPVPALA